MRRTSKHIAISLLSAITVLTSCLTDEIKGDALDDTTIVLTLKMPNVASTRSITEDAEREINDVNVLAFIKAGSDWVYEYAATNVKKNTNGSNMTVTATVRKMNQDQQFVILANSVAELTSAAPVRGEPIATIEERLVCKVGDGVWSISPFTSFPMYARTDAVRIDAGGNTISTSPYPMIRMVARIDVGMRSNAIIPSDYAGFKLKEAYLFNYKKAGYVSYFNSYFNGNSASDPAVSTPAIPAAGDYTNNPMLKAGPYPVDGNEEIIRSIYTFESEGFSDRNLMTTKTALVIGAVYGSGITAYYRIDLKTDDDGNQANISGGILRNHRYIVKVQAVTGPGYETPEEAYLGETQITADITAWSDARQDVIIDKQYYLKANPGSCTFPSGGGTLSVTAVTDYSISNQGYLAGIVANAADIEYDSPASDWLSLSLSDGTTTRTISITALANSGTAERTARVYVKAGNLTKVIDIKQEFNSSAIVSEANCYLLVPNGKGIRIPVSRANKHLATAIGESDVFTAELLWTENSKGIHPESNIKFVSIEGVGRNGYVCVEPGSAEGNAVVAVKVGGVIKWSWHIWVTKFELPAAATSGTFLDRNLGAMDNKAGVKSYGLVYQWGRKDPFPGANAFYNTNTYVSIYTSSGSSTSIPWSPATETPTLDKTIISPMTFYYQGGSTFDWYTTVKANQNSTLWNKNKTVYDPCPAGWKVPDGSAWTGLLASDFTWTGSSADKSQVAGGTKNDTKAWYPFPGHWSAMLSGLSPTGLNQQGRYWRAASISTQGSCVIFNLSGVTVNEGQGSEKEFGQSVRCVKE